MLRAQEESARTIARIRGTNSKAALAIIDLDQRRAGGESVFLVSLRGEWLVAPAAELAQLTELAAKKSKETARLAADKRALPAGRITGRATGC